MQAIAQVLVAEGVRLLGGDRFAEAIAVLQQACATVRRSGVINAWDAPAFPWLATALRRQLESLPPSATTERRALLRDAERAARRALRIARKFRNDRPHALREAGLLAAQRGHARQARQMLDDSLQEAERQGARYEQALTLQARGEVGQRFGWPEALAQLDAAREALRAWQSPGAPQV